MVHGDGVIRVRRDKQVKITPRFGVARVTGGQGVRRAPGGAWLTAFGGVPGVVEIAWSGRIPATRTGGSPFCAHAGVVGRRAGAAVQGEAMDTGHGDDRGTVPRETRITYGCPIANGWRPVHRARRVRTAEPGCRASTRTTGRRQATTPATTPGPIPRRAPHGTRSERDTERDNEP